MVTTMSSLNDPENETTIHIKKPEECKGHTPPHPAFLMKNKMPYALPQKMKYISKGVHPIYTHYSAVRQPKIHRGPPIGIK